MEWLILAAATAVNVALWFFRPTWLRRRLGIEEEPEPEPYYFTEKDTSRGALEGDPVIGGSVREVYASGRYISWQPLHQVEPSLQEGLELFRAPNGGRVLSIPRESGRFPTRVLMIHP